ncbi:MAG: phage portal protein [Marinilabiliaceae bacterium]|nr:phage portal protein [Marinilabiliaceae bacterium]
MAFEFSIKFGKSSTEARSLENPNTPITMDGLADIIGNSSASISGAKVSPDSALTLSAVYRAVNLLSGTIAALPWHVYRRDFNNNVNIDAAHPLFFLLHDEPYHLYSSYKFREVLMSHILLYDGNFYAIILRDAYNNVAGLKIIQTPQAVQVVLTSDDQLFYFVPGYLDPFPARDIFHVAGFGFDGLKGKTPIRIAREAFGLGLTLQEFGLRFFNNGAHVGSVVEHPTKFTEDQYNRFRDSWERAYSSVKNTGKTVILEGGAKLNKVGIPPEEAQFLESRKFSIDEVARFFGLPPHMLAQMDGATFSNIEHQGIELVQYTLLQHCRNIESEVQRKLVRPSERRYISNRLNLDGLLRGDSASRATYLSTLVNAGIYTRDEARELENKNRRGGLADEMMFPLNMATSDQFKANVIKQKSSSNA